MILGAQVHRMRNSIGLCCSIIFIILAFVLLIEVEAAINVPFSCHFLDFYCFSKSH